MNDLKISQRALATASGVSRSTTRRFLCGGPHVKMETLQQLLQALGYDVSPVQTGKLSPDLFREHRKAVKRPVRPKLIKAAGCGRRF
ncbi:helix-turn-helix domain-containing protein [Agrobacterium rosae]